MKYNAVADVVVSADDKGIIEYWCPATLQFPKGRFMFDCIIVILFKIIWDGLYPKFIKY